MAASLLSVCDTGAGHSLSPGQGHGEPWPGVTPQTKQTWIFLVLPRNRTFLSNILKNLCSKVSNFILHYLTCSSFLFGEVQQGKLINFKCLKNTLASIFDISFDAYIIPLVLSWLFYSDRYCLTFRTASGLAYESPNCPSSLERRVLGCAALAEVWAWEMCVLVTWCLISSFLHITIIPGDSWCPRVFCPWCTSHPNPNFGSVPAFLLAIKLCFKVSSSLLMGSVRVFLHACITFVIKALSWLLFHHFIQLGCLPSPFLCSASRARG